MEVAYPKLDGNGKEIAACFLGNGLASGDTAQVDVAWFYESLLALDRPKELLGKAGKWNVSHG